MLLQKPKSKIKILEIGAEIHKNEEKNGKYVFITNSTKNLSKNLLETFQRLKEKQDAVYHHSKLNRF